MDPERLEIIEGLQPATCQWLDIGGWLCFRDLVFVWCYAASVQFRQFVWIWILKQAGPV